MVKQAPKRGKITKKTNIKIKKIKKVLPKPKKSPQAKKAIKKSPSKIIILKKK